MQTKSHPPLDGALARIATRQHGVVSQAQLRALGLSPGAIKYRAGTGRLHRVHKGVYAVGHRRLTTNGRWLAAVLACGPTAVLSHRTALSLWGLRPASGPIHVTVVARGRTSTDFALHCVRALDPRDRVALDDIPVTTVPRTLLDYADVARPQQLRLALEAAERRELLDHAAIHHLIERTPGRHGIAALNEALQQLAGPAPWTQSELERRFLALIRAAGLPEPSCNVSVAGHVVDFCWPQARLIVEVDGYGFHRTRAQFEADRRRDAALQLAGYRVIRVTQRRIADEPAQLILELRRMICYNDTKIFTRTEE